MDFRRLFTTEIGKIILSIILGLGLASLFRSVCTSKNCLNFNGPVISDIEDQIYEHGNKCFKYELKSDTCDKTKKIIPFASEEEE
tara:strand:- start:2562 stop:2816 length:255 start_codon:yes stop_codon:yes gene_type:complete